MTEPAFDAIAACVFDAYGTLFDVHSAVERGGAALGDRAAAVSALWRQKQLEYTWLRSLMGAHADFRQVTKDGLGYAPVGEKWHKIPQVGIVEIGDDVEIGANCAIDRATLGRTVIAAGTKFSNLVAIGHGTKIGEDYMFVAQVGSAGILLKWPRRLGGGHHRRDACATSKS